MMSSFAYQASTRILTQTHRAVFIHTHTHCNVSVGDSSVTWITVLLLVSWHITRNTIRQAWVKLAFGEKTASGSLIVW